jgi:hypothetical protein
LLRQRDDDALGAADVAEQVFDFVLHHLADELEPGACRRARTSWMSSTANMMRRMPSVFTGAFGSAVVAGGA